MLRPNQSLTWHTTLLLLGMLALLSMTIAVSFSVRGYWLILPFTLLELTAVFGCFYYLLVRSQRQQVIEFFADSVQVSSGRLQPEDTHVWQRYFTKIFVNPPRHMWYPPQILLQHRDESIELGEFLTSAEKHELVTHLRRLVQLANERQMHPA